MRKPVVILFVAAAVVLLSVGARHRVVTPPGSIPLDVHRSLVLTDLNDTVGFTLQRVLQALITDSGATDTTPLSMYRQWFDTQNPKPGLAMADAPHCDDFMTNGMPSFNGFPRRCPTPEGPLAASNPFATKTVVGGDYTPMGVINRFDLTPADGSNCGRYRIIFANTTKHPPFEKLHIMFDAVLPNSNGGGRGGLPSRGPVLGRSDGHQ